MLLDFDAWGCPIHRSDDLADDFRQCASCGDMVHELDAVDNEDAGESRCKQCDCTRHGQDFADALCCECHAVAA